MFNIGQYFEKFAKIGLKNEFVKNSIAESIKKITGISIPFTSIEYKNHIIFITAHPAIKNTLSMKKKGVLEEVRLMGVKVDDLK